MKHKTSLKAILLTTLLQAKALTVVLLLTIIGAIVFGLLPPLVLERAVDRMTAGEAPGLPLAVLYFAMLGLSGLFDAGKEFLITVLGQRITRGLRSAMCEKLSRLPAQYYTSQDPGATVSRFVGDVDTVEALFASGIVSMAVDICKVCSIVAVIFVKSRGLGILLLLLTPVLFKLTRVFQKRMLAAHLDNRKAVSRVTHHVPETIRNIRMIHVMARESYMEQRYGEALEDSFRAVERSNFYDAIYSPIITVMSALVVAVMMLCASLGGSWQALFGMTVGSAVAVTNYVGKVFTPLESIGMEIQNIQSAMAGIQRIREFLNQPEQADANETLTAETLQGSGAPAVALEDLHFSYDGKQEVLHGCTWQVERGETVTLTGRTGAGKSTVFKLLLGLYQPDSGNVSVLGSPAAEVPAKLRRHLFGYVEQSFRLVPGTVVEQISLWDDRISLSDVVSAAKLVGLHDVICALPKGYDTPCTESLFSQGQFQLLSIARAVAADPEILLLDEITANLDAETEHLVLDALQKAAENRTVVSISHRLYSKSGGRQIAIG